MLKYFISSKQQATGVHIIHRENCPLLPGKGERIFIGIFRSPHDANMESKRYFRRVTTCPFCMKQTHPEGKTMPARELHAADCFGSYEATGISLANVLMYALN